MYNTRRLGPVKGLEKRDDMPRRPKEEAEKTRARILARALTLFAAKGYEHTTFTDIAAALKLTKGAVYWYFASKEELLLALVEEMLAKFAAEIGEVMPQEALTFPVVAEMMVAYATRIVANPRDRAYFLLMHEQIRWSSDSMKNVRERLLTESRVGPWKAFCVAVANDVATGRARADVNPERVAHTCLAIWSGLVHASISQFMTCGLAETMRPAFAGVWGVIRREGGEVL